MAKKPKKATELTSDEVMDRVFGKGTAKKLHTLVEQVDAQKGRKTTEKKGPNRP